MEPMGYCTKPPDASQLTHTLPVVLREARLAHSNTSISSSGCNHAEGVQQHAPGMEHQACFSSTSASIFTLGSRLCCHVTISSMGQATHLYMASMR